MTPPTGTVVDDPPSIDPRIRQRRLAIRRNEGRRRLRWIVGLVLVVVLVVGGWVLLHTGLFSADAIAVTGVHPQTTDAAIVDAAGLGDHPPLVSVDPGAAAGRVESLPFVATARVERHWPDGVTVSVTERVPTATMAGPGTSWSVLDGSGRTLEVVPTRPPGLLELTEDTPTGALVPAPVGGTLRDVDAAGLTVVRTLPKAFSAQVVSVTAAPDGTVGLVLNSGIHVLLGTGTELTAKYEDVAAIIAHASLRGVTTIDVSVPGSPAVG